MPYVVLALCLIVGIALMGRWLLNAEPRQILRAAKWTAIILAIGFVLFLAFVGGFRSAAIIAATALPFIFRGRAIWRAVRNAAKAARGPTPGQQTGVRTRWLAMTLDHDTGAMDGEILQGPFAGRFLSDLSPAELSALADELEGDTESLQVFEAWLARMGPEVGPEADAQSGAGSGREAPPGRGDESGMTIARAREILGVAEDANEAEIREAHRRLMRANHPDRGGSSWLATQINLAKDILLRQG